MIPVFEGPGVQGPTLDLSMWGCLSFASTAGLSLVSL